jgi:hypothetical protein
MKRDEQGIEFWCDRVIERETHIHSSITHRHAHTLLFQHTAEYGR